MERPVPDVQQREGKSKSLTRLDVRPILRQRAGQAKQRGESVAQEHHEEGRRKRQARLLPDPDARRTGARRDQAALQQPAQHPANAFSLPPLTLLEHALGHPEAEQLLPPDVPPPEQLHARPHARRAALQQRKQFC